MITWLHVLTGNQVRVFHADERWQPFGDFSVADLKRVDYAALAPREAAVYKRTLAR